MKEFHLLILAMFLWSVLIAFGYALLRFIAWGRRPMQQRARVADERAWHDEMRASNQVFFCSCGEKTGVERVLDHAYVCACGKRYIVHERKICVVEERQEWGNANACGKCEGTGIRPYYYTGTDCDCGGPNFKMLTVTAHHPVSLFQE